VIPEQVQTDPNYSPDPIPDPDQLLSLAAAANIIEMPVDRSTVHFYHQLLQEYFAARELLKRGKSDLSGFGNLTGLWRWPWLESEMPPVEQAKDSWEPLPPPPPTGWEETTILAAGMAPDNDDQLGRALIEINPVLAGRCLYEGRPQVDPALRQQVIDALLQTIARPEVALRVRIAAGEVLGYLGDPRLGQVVTISAGKFRMGDNKGRDNEKPQHELFLPDYQIGRYPLTNAEFAHFIEAGGYHDQRWWTEAGWREKEKPTFEAEPWTEPRWWDDADYNKPNHPVVGVSWYEILAFCRWLSAETGRSYRLPSEAEWEKAARGRDGRQHPWGNKFEARRLNAFEGSQPVHATTPVGIYPTGVSPFKVFDCAGNVWEWCATKAGEHFMNPKFKAYPYDIDEDEWLEAYLNGTDIRALRGGTYISGEDDTRCTIRVRNSPYFRDRLNGFRLLVAPI
jgi:formylglycine-generating enzyme required for sulfatase activity